MIVQMHGVRDSDLAHYSWSHAVDWRTLFTVQATEKQPTRTPGLWFEAPENYVAHWDHDLAHLSHLVLACSSIGQQQGLIQELGSSRERKIPSGCGQSISSQLHKTPKTSVNTLKQPTFPGGNRSSLPSPALPRS